MKATTLTLAIVFGGLLLTPPADARGLSTEQIQTIAENPEWMAELLADADTDDMIAVSLRVILQIVQSDWPPAVEEARIVQVVHQLFASRPADEGTQLAQALAIAVAPIPELARVPQLISIIQRTVITAASLAAGTVFGNEFNLAMQSIGGASAPGNVVPPPPPPPVARPSTGVPEPVVPPPPPPPPVARPYSGQDLP